LAGVVAGGGTVSVTSGSLTLDSNSGFGASVLSESGSSTSISINNSLNLVGALSQTSGVLTIASGQTLILSSSGKVDTITGVVNGGGTLAFAGGSLTVAAGATFKPADWVVSGGTATIATNLTYAGNFNESGGTLSLGAGDTLTLTGSDTIGGVVAGTGTLAVIGAVLALNASTLSAQTNIAGSSVTLSGSITDSASVNLTGSTVTVTTGGATLLGGGNLVMDAATTISGAGATLTNSAATISGAGALGGGQMILVNKLTGVVNGNAASALVIDAGANTISNAGLIETTGAGGVTIQSAIANNGTLLVTSGTMSLNGVVTGAGSATISGGVLDCNSAFNENVTFTGTGVLALAQSQTFKKAIAGFSPTGANALDLGDIAFTGGNQATYSGTATSGVLTVTDGVHTAKINLTGNYLNSTFTCSSDGQGGILVVDPTRRAKSVIPPAAESAVSLIAPPAASAVQLFASAISAFTGVGCSAMASHETYRPLPPPLLTTVR
jgi:hypothetical protein